MYAAQAANAKHASARTHAHTHTHTHTHTHIHINSLSLSHTHSLPLRCTGDGWMTAVLRPLIKIGEADGRKFFALWTCAFFISYIMLVYVVLLNVAVAVLLEGFLSSMTEHDMELKAQLGTLEYSKISGCLDPLIASFSSFDSADQLRQMIGNLFKHLDGNSSNSVSF